MGQKRNRRDRASDIRCDDLETATLKKSGRIV
jgi:hypothetical protein